MSREEELTSSILTVRYKIVFVGDNGVGKTSVMNRFIKGTFVEDYDATIGIDFSSKIIEYKENPLKIQMWDSAGQERYKSLIPSYVRGSSIIFIVYEISKKETFDKLINWVSFIKEVNTDNAILVLCGNKIDLEREVTTKEGEAYAKKENLMFFEVSAKDDLNINEMMYSSIAELPFFGQIEDKATLVKELIEINSNKDAKTNSSIYDIVKGQGTENNIKELNVVSKNSNKEKKACTC